MSYNEILFTIGRMNPPTPGHLELIRTMIRAAVSENIPRIDIILSHTAGDAKNLLDCHSKRAFLVDKEMVERLRQQMIELEEDAEIRGKIETLVIVVRCTKPITKSPSPKKSSTSSSSSPSTKKKRSNGSPIFNEVLSVIDENIDMLRENGRLTGDIRARIIVGKDRDFTGTMTKFLQEARGVTFQQTDVSRKNMEEFATMSISKLEKKAIIPIESISASLVRNVVRAQKYELFKRLYENVLAPGDIDEMYNSLLYIIEHPVIKEKVKKQPATAKNKKALAVTATSASAKKRETAKKRPRKQLPVVVEDEEIVEMVEKQAPYFAPESTETIVVDLHTTMPRPKRAQKPNTKFLDLKVGGGNL